jgi:hypothetical protein
LFDRVAGVQLALRMLRPDGLGFDPTQIDIKALGLKGHA